MNTKKILSGVFVLFMIIIILSNIGSALPSENFFKKNDDVYDDWNIARTRAYGSDGFFQISMFTGNFRPSIVFESLGTYKDSAYRLGEQYAQWHTNQYELAESIFYFVRDNVQYTSDIDQFDYQEFAQNADELINRIDNGFGYGDCEDVAILLNVIYNGAGLRSAIVLAPSHAAAAVYLPGYDKANVYWTFNGESGWVWAEATGRNNLFGKTPTSLIEEDIVFYDIINNVQGSAKVMTDWDGGGGTIINIPSELIFMITIIVMFILSLLRRH